MLVASAALGRVTVQHPAGPGLGARRRPRLRRPHDGRLRRRPADPRPPAPDDRRRPAGRAAARRGRRPHHGRAAARRGPRARRRPTTPPPSSRPPCTRPGTPASPSWSSVTGTRDDPQGLREQVAALHGAGAWVHLSNAAAARCALDLLGAPGVNLSTPPAVVTAGASLLADALRAQAVDVSEVQWQPPAGDPAALAAVMGDPRRVAGQRAGADGDAGRGGAPGRRTPGGGGARPRPRGVPARRPADRVGAGVRADAGRAGRRDAARGPGRRPRRTPSAGSPPGTA